MREIAFKQADSGLATGIEKNGQNFVVLAYAVSGNPRLLLETLAQSRSMGTRDVNEVIETFYRSTIWTEHSGLAESYTGHRPFIVLGAYVIENVVLTETKAKNDRRQSDGQQSQHAISGFTAIRPRSLDTRYDSLNTQVSF